MRNRNHDIMGAALGFPVIGAPPGAWGPGYGGPWGGYPVAAFGMTLDGGQDGAPTGPMMAPPCGYPQAYADPNLINALILKQHAAIVGADCGPQEVEQMFGFKDGDAIEPGATATFEATPEIVAKLTRLFIPTSVASQLVVVDLTIGIKSQFPGKGSIPALVFSEVSTNNRINGDTCYIRQPIVLTVKNTSEASVTFNGAVGVVGVQGAGPRIYGPGSGHQ